MLINRDSLVSVSNLHDDVIASIRQDITNFLQRCGLQYVDVMLDETLYAECCQEAVNRGFPMDGDNSIRPWMVIGVAMMSNPYAHLPDRATRMWICLLTVVGVYIDDMMNKGKDLVHVYRFNERFTSYQPQGDPVMNAFDALVREAACLYPPPASNRIVTSSLNFITSILLDNETKDMQISTRTPLYAEYWRNLSGFQDAFAVMIFPSTLPLREYVQCIPDLWIIINHANDILSYYKEEFEGDTVNYLSVMATSRALTKQDVLHEIIEKTVQAHHHILESLRPHAKAHDAYINFFEGYVKFHIGLRRYRLKEVMSERSTS
ncbi:isoprenoid synthase domain-containing protein [Suillus ampliporus]|nr:isoprenoid synthase domain-containing protein [Suillus ampliporus]